MLARITLFTCNPFFMEALRHAEYLDDIVTALAGLVM